MKVILIEFYEVMIKIFFESFNKFIFIKIFIKYNLFFMKFFLEM